MMLFPWSFCGRGICLLRGFPCGRKNGLAECSPRPDTIYPGATPNLEGGRVVACCPANWARPGSVANAAANVTPVAARNFRRRRCVRVVILYLLAKCGMAPRVRRSMHWVRPDPSIPRGGRETFAQFLGICRPGRSTRERTFHWEQRPSGSPIPQHFDDPFARPPIAIRVDRGRHPAVCLLVFEQFLDVLDDGVVIRADDARESCFRGLWALRCLA